MYRFGNGIKPQWGWSIASQLEPRARAVVRGVDVALHFLGSVASSGNKEGANLIIFRLNSNITSLSASLVLL